MQVHGYTGRAVVVVSCVTAEPPYRQQLILLVFYIIVSQNKFFFIMYFPRKVKQYRYESPRKEAREVRFIGLRELVSYAVSNPAQ
jgi:hypothetical protein